MSKRFAAYAVAALVLLSAGPLLAAGGKGGGKGGKDPDAPPPPPPDPAVVECKVPFKPATGINGVTATEDQLTVFFNAVKRYQSQLGVYRSCLDAKIQAAATANDDTQVKALTHVRDLSVDDETAVVTAYNGALHSFCASHPNHGVVSCPTKG